jgi:valyl-tRNA synthetase
VPNNAKPWLAIQSNTPELTTLFKENVGVVSSLTKACEVVIVPVGEAAPSGCLRGFVTDDVASHVRIAGLINIKDEQKRIDKRSAQLEDLIKKLKAKMGGKAYETKVPEAVRI